MLNIETFPDCECKEVVRDNCIKCDLNFDYIGQYVDDTPYPACEVIRDIIFEAKRRKKEMNNAQTNPA